MNRLGTKTTPKPAPQGGPDYYLEDGRCVFTAAFLSRRGSCCGNGCRHCPYDGQRHADPTGLSRRR